MTRAPLYSCRDCGAATAGDAPSDRCRWCEHPVCDACSRVAADGQTACETCLATHEPAAEPAPPRCETCGRAVQPHERWCLRCGPQYDVLAREQRERQSIGRAPDCSETFAELGAAELGHLTGLTHRVAAALVHLREAWLIADDAHASAIEEALGALFRSPMLARTPAAYRPILCHGLDERQDATLWSHVMAWFHADDGETDDSPVSPRH